MKESQQGWQIDSEGHTGRGRRHDSERKHRWTKRRVFRSSDNSNQHSIYKKANGAKSRSYFFFAVLSAIFPSARQYLGIPSSACV